MKRFGSIALAAVAALATVHAANAQLPGLPYGPVNTGLGINVAADYGKPNNDYGGGSAWGLTGGLGVSRFGLQASIGSWKPTGATSGTSTIAGAAGMRLFGGGLVPLSIGVQIGGSHASYSGLGVTTIEPAAWVKLSPPLFPLKPWAQVYYVTGTCGTGCTVTKEPRFTLGANFNLLLGLGVHASYDIGTKSNPKTGNVWGVGAHFNFRLPGL